MHMKNLDIIDMFFFIFSCSKNIREIERVWKKSCINDRSMLERSKNSMQSIIENRTYPFEIICNR